MLRVATLCTNGALSSKTGGTLRPGSTESGTVAAPQPMFACTSLSAPESCTPLPNAAGEGGRHVLRSDTRYRSADSYLRISLSQVPKDAVRPVSMAPNAENIGGSPTTPKLDHLASSPHSPSRWAGQVFQEDMYCHAANLGSQYACREDSEDRGRNAESRSSKTSRRSSARLILRLRCRLGYLQSAMSSMEICNLR